MTLSNPAAWFAICALCLLIGGALARGDFFRARLAESAAGRFETLDGLRGFLALGVLGGHAVNMHALHTSGVWNAGEASFYSQAANAGVALFFAITGFLFWLRVLREGPRFDARAFFASRLRRLVPMYAVSVAMALAVVLVASGFALHEPPVALLKELRPWLSFGFMTTGETNGVRDAHAINAVYWTLAYEWMFYLALPLLALLARGRWSLLLPAAALFFGTQSPIVFNFLSGALAAVLVQRRTLGSRLGAAWLAPLPLAALAAYFLAPGLPPAARVALLFAVFVFVVHGYSFFGLLRSRAAKVLGAASYSIYLTHCIVLFVVVRSAHHVVPIGALEPLQYWLLVSLAAAATVLLSAYTFRHVEYPFIHQKGATARPMADPARIQVA
jgi:peptidoglycan/LPS O-acetylase OafA/YrhL